MNPLSSSDGVDFEVDLDQAAMKRLGALGSARLFRHNQHLYRQGDPAGQVFVLLSGSVKATSSQPNGFETLLKIHGPGSLLGLSALRPGGIRDANGIAIGEVQTVCLPNARFLKLVEEDGSLALQLIRTLLKRQQQLHNRIRRVLGNSVEQRLADTLLQLTYEASAAGDGGREPELSITHEDLAAMVLSRRQYVTLIMRDFVSNGLIETGRKRVRVLDPDGLRQIADE